jgi:Domain of unknown function (DUF3883)
VRDAERMTELVGNKAIEAAAIEWVMELERAAGREPRDTRFAGAPADLLSPPRVIEVKAFGTSNRGYDLWLETRQMEEARSNRDFYVYVVERPSGRSGNVHPPSARRRPATESSGAGQGAAIFHRPVACRPLRQLPHRT